MISRKSINLFCFASLLLLTCFPLSSQVPTSGQLSMRATAAKVNQATLFNLLDETQGWFLDYSTECRLLFEAEPAPDSRLVAHYEIFFASGDRRSVENRLFHLFDDESLLQFMGSGGLDDTTRLLDLTGTLHRGNHSIIKHRLDRLAWTWTPSWGSLTMGREAVTWGNGLIFNPMDLFNPFSPTDIEREYKNGDDLILLQFTQNSWDHQVITVPRRSAVSGNLEVESSSIGWKAHYSGNELEFDFLSAWHYDEPVAGMGLIGYLGQAAWRGDVIGVFHDEGNPSLLAVINLDYSWMWQGKNCYGLLEFYYNSDGASGDYLSAMNNSNLFNRLSRNEVYTLGKRYLAGTWQIELHPLVNLYSTALVNLHDPSGQFLPRLIWEPSQDMQVLLGANLFFGATNTEFGGLEISLDNDLKVRARTPHSAYVWIKYYF